MDALRTSWDPPYRSHHHRWDETPSEQARRQRFRELRPPDPGLPYGKRDPEMPSPEESRPGRHSTGVVMPPVRGSTPQDPNMAKLEYLWNALDKLESRMDAYDRRLEKLRLPKRPDPNPPYGFHDSGGSDWGQRHRRYAQPDWGPKSYVHRPHKVYQRSHNPEYQARPTEQQFRRDKCNLTESGSFASRANRYPAEIPNSGMFEPLYSRPPARQPSGWDSSPHRAARRYSSYDQPRNPTYWDSPPYGQPPYLSAESPQKPYAGSHPGQHEDQPTPSPYRPPRSPTGWESQQYVPPIPLGCPPPHAVESRRLSRPYLHHDPSCPSLPVVAAVPPSVLTQPALSCCPDVSRDEGELLHDDPDVSRDEGELLHDDPPPLAPILQLYNPNISEEDETWLEDKEEDGSIGEVEKKIASVNVAQMSSKDVENCGFKRGGACSGVRIIAYIYVDFFDGDVPSIVHCSTSLGVDARFIPPRNDTPYLSLLGGDRGISSVVRYTFDPGGDASPKLFAFNSRLCFVVPTLRTRWISTVGELIRIIYFKIS